MKSKLKKEFLKDKYENVELFSAWARAKIPISTSSANVHVISDNVLEMTEFNFLPSTEEDILDGHYTFFVNVNSFDWAVYKSSNYGSLTWVRESENTSFLEEVSLPDITRLRIEAVIAHKLMGCYHYDGDHINQNGANLIEGGIRKGSLICDYRKTIWVGKTEPNEPTDKEKSALKILDKENV
jgi:hypothetical protein